MSTQFATHAQIAAVLRERPAGYEADLMRCAVARTAEGVTFDTGGDCWRRLFQKYRPGEDADVTAARGRAAWHRLHTEGVGQDAAWLEAWLRTDVPCGECRQKARKVLADRPPTFPLRAEWTFEFHNDINAALGKPLAAFVDVAPMYAWL